jgi:hypothetical protein
MVMTKSNQNQNDEAYVDAAERDYEEDILREQVVRTQNALLLQAEATQSALKSLKASIDATQGTIAPTVQKVLEDMLKPYQNAPAPNGNQMGILPSGSGGILNMVEPIMKLLGLGNQSNALDSQLQEMFQYQFKRTTLGLWSQAFKDINKKMGLPEHLDIASEGMHLNP